MTRILVVDDAKIDLVLVGSLLEDQGYEVLTAGRGDEALELVEELHPDLVLTDLIMPEMDGLELVGLLRERHPGLPVILMTSRGNEEVAVEALQAGASSYVPKRALEEHLCDTLDDVLATSLERHQEQEIYEAMRRSAFEYELPNDVRLIGPLVRHVRRATQQMGVCDAAQGKQVAIALHEAIQNAAEHGNLELSSDLRQDDLGDYFELMAERAEQLPFKDRRVRVDVFLSRTEARFTVSDEGSGFDPRSLPDPRDPSNLEKVSGRGVLLMATFMDEVNFNDKGNVVTLVKRRPIQHTRSIEQ